jgi:hypothetical protein
MKKPYPLLLAILIAFAVFLLLPVHYKGAPECVAAHRSVTDFSSGGCCVPRNDILDICQLGDLKKADGYLPFVIAHQKDCDGFTIYSSACKGDIDYKWVAVDAAVALIAGALAYRFFSRSKTI